MTLHDRLRQLASALPSDDSAVTITRADLMALLEEGGDPATLGSDLTAQETGRARSTVRGWLIAGMLRGYKLNGRDWRIPRAALRDYLTAQTRAWEPPGGTGNVDITAWRRAGRGCGEECRARARGRGDAKPYPRP